MALVSKGPGVSIEAKLVARRYCGVSATCARTGEGMRDDLAVNDKLPDHVQVSRGVRNQALLGGMVLLDGLEDLDRLAARVNLPGGLRKGRLLALAIRASQFPAVAPGTR